MTDNNIENVEPQLAPEIEIAAKPIEAPIPVMQTVEPTLEIMPEVIPPVDALEDVISDLNKSGSQARAVSSQTPERNQSRDQLAPILDIPVKLDVMFSSISMPVSRLMELHEGSQIDLCRSAGEPVDLCINGCVVARGVLFLMDGPEKRVGVRITASSDQIDTSAASL